MDGHVPVPQRRHWFCWLSPEEWARRWLFRHWGQSFPPPRRMPPTARKRNGDLPSSCPVRSPPPRPTLPTAAPPGTSLRW
ncbi:hypothetical protein ACFFX0_01045 [Citricoccus parietis]|uniref:Uncharacterized protein n=1 Tax=Citricoccus parietis TaxID=592307 RepID=A0ABV5FT47_9MICC